mmetsp:Transcript_15525/g.30493  ORF Transcript_15525/g.30493 Transcript_15525/m.30493 type:complete len:203 (-) Transcript_15525:282-890(-)
MGNLIYSPPVGKNVLFLGQENSGKTHTLMQLVFQSCRIEADPAEALKPQPTIRMNNERLTFVGNQSSEVFEFWDFPGAPHFRYMWEATYQNVVFDYVVYFIDAMSCHEAKDHQRLNHDRMELQSLLKNESLRNTKKIVYLNWKSDSDDVRDFHSEHEILDALGLVPNQSQHEQDEEGNPIRLCEIVETFKSLHERLEIPERH